MSNLELANSIRQIEAKIYKCKLEAVPDTGSESTDASVRLKAWRNFTDEVYKFEMSNKFSTVPNESYAYAFKEEFKNSIIPGFFEFIKAPETENPLYIKCVNSMLSLIDKYYGKESTERADFLKKCKKNVTVDFDNHPKRVSSLNRDTFSVVEEDGK